MEANNTRTKDLIVIGGGAGGLVVASGCAQLGLNVTLIEKEPFLGGDCLHYGCIPSKTLIHTAKVAQLMRQAHKLGLHSVEPDIALSKVMQHVQDVIARIQVHDDPKRFESYGVEVIFGQAQFMNKRTLRVCGEDLQAKRFVIATGSKAMIPDLPGLEDIDYLTNETVFKLRQLPEHLVILGGGIISVELGQAFARLGAKVTIMERGDRILKQIDPQASAVITEVLQKESLNLLTESHAKQVIRQGSRFELVFEHAGIEKTIQGTHLLVATGRVADTASLNLAAAGVEATPQGIAVNAKLKSSNKKIYAVGDVVASPYKFTHMAEFHASVAIANIAFKVPKKIKHAVVPSVIFTDPEIALVGESEQSLQEKHIRFQTLEVPFAGIDRAIAQNETQGFIKIYIRKKHILGAVIVGPQAGELVAEVCLAIQSKIPFSQISSTIHAYPTLSQVVRRCVNTYYAPKLFSTKTKRLVKFLQIFS